MSAASEDTIVLAGEYVLGVLPPEEAQAVEMRLEKDEALKAAIAEWRHRFGELDAMAPPVTPSAGLWRSIERAIAQPDAPAAQARKPYSIWRSVNFWRGAALAMSAACVALTIGLARQIDRPQPVVIAVLEADDSTPGAIVEAYADGSVRLVPLTDIPVPPGRALQVWTLWDRARGPVPLGLLNSAHQAVLTVDGQPRPRPQQLYEITLEPASGSPTGRPTGPILYKGLASAPR